MSDPTFSVIIAAYQAADFIGVAIDSALEQDPPPLEVIVGDDGSTDDLKGALARFGSAVQTVRIKHAGEAAAKNAGAAVARGDFLSFLDADDCYLPGRLAAIAELLEREPDDDIVTADAYIVHREERLGRVYGEQFPFAAERQREAILRGNFVLGNAAIRRSRFAEVGGFDPNVAYTTDWELCVRLILTGSKVGFVDSPLAEYRLHAGSMSARRALMSRGRLDTLDRASARADLSPEERSILKSTRVREQSRLERELMKEALSARSSGAARSAAAGVLRSGKQSLAAKAKALAVLAVPGVMSRLHLRRTEGTFTTVGDRRLES